MITSINADLLADHGKKIRVGIIDSGFSLLPSYATLHGTNYHNGTEHGDRMLSIFTALDRKYPLIIIDVAVLYMLFRPYKEAAKLTTIN